jgi:hypothetical protein
MPRACKIRVHGSRAAARRGQSARRPRRRRVPRATAVLLVVRGDRELGVALRVLLCLRLSAATRDRVEPLCSDLPRREPITGQPRLKGAATGPLRRPAARQRIPCTVALTGRQVRAAGARERLAQARCGRVTEPPSHGIAANRGHRHPGDVPATVYRRPVGRRVVSLDDRATGLRQHPEADDRHPRSSGRVSSPCQLAASPDQLAGPLGRRQESTQPPFVPRPPALLPPGDRSSGLKAAGVRCRSAELHVECSTNELTAAFCGCRSEAGGDRAPVYYSSSSNGRARSLTAVGYRSRRGKRVQLALIRALCGTRT